MLRTASLILVVGLFIPFVLAQETTVIPESNELPRCDIPAPLKFAHVAGVAFENLAFDGAGSMFLTAFEDGLYQAFPNGTVQFVTKDSRPIPPAEAVGINGPNHFMGVDIGPDGALYVSEGMAINSPVSARVLRFPVPGAPEFEVYASGFDGANGMAWGSDGKLYLAHGFRTELWQITGPNMYTIKGHYPTVNGVVAMPDGRLAIAQYGDQAQGVSAINLTTGNVEVLFRFNAGPSVAGNQPGMGPSNGPLQTKGIDDFTVLDDGRIVASAHLRLQFVLGDPKTGSACILLNDVVAEPTSARVAKGFDAWDGWVFTTDNAGDIYAINLTLDAPAAEHPGGAAAQTSKGTPAIGWTWGLLTLAVVAAARRRRQ